MYLPSMITTSIMNLSGFLHKYKPVFNQHIYYYENHNDNCINSIQKSYESWSNKAPIEATDCDTSRLTTTSLLNYVKDTSVKETIKPTAMTIGLKYLKYITIYLRYYNPTDFNMTNSLQETPDVNDNSSNITWNILLNRNMTDTFAEIFVSISTILPPFQFWLLNMTGVVKSVYAIQSMKFIPLIFQRRKIIIMKFTVSIPPIKFQLITILHWLISSIMMMRMTLLPFISLLYRLWSMTVFPTANSITSTRKRKRRYQQRQWLHYW